jgi:hypothetical protein
MTNFAMIVEIIHTRGLQLYINDQGVRLPVPHRCGQKPTHSSWSIGEDCKGGYEFRDSLNSDSGIKIGDYEVTGMRYDVSMKDFGKGADPTEVTLFTDKGDITLPVVEIRNGYLAARAAEEDKSDEEVNDLMTVKLTNGETRILDEFHTYVMAAS